MVTTTILRTGLTFAFFLWQASVFAQTAQSSPPPAEQPVPAPAPAEAPQPTPAQPTPPLSEQRSVSLTPTPVESAAAGRPTFQVDPIADGSIIAATFSFGVVLDRVNSTGEIRPQQITPDFDRNQLLAIDRVSLTRTPNAAAATLSNVGVFIAGAYAVVDPILTGFREHSRQAAVVDAVLYAESASSTFAMTNIVKMAVRRPRPSAYIEAEEHQGDPSYSNASTDSALSFFSAHASMTAALGATATYLAFTRSKSALRPWLTLGFATAVTALVSAGRVASGKHFPTDVIAGSIAGAGIGLLVPHLHRTDTVEQRRVWVGFNPVPAKEGEGSSLTFSGNF